MPIVGANNVNGIAANGSEQSVTMASEGLERSMNQNAVKQMQLMEKQGNHQLMQTVVKQASDMMNSAKENTANIRL